MGLNNVYNMSVFTEYGYQLNATVDVSQLSH